jgi:hypothetical protein
MSSAQDRVFSITELLEQILLHLDNQQLLLLQRVCRHWSSLIAGSPEISQKLYLRAIGAPRPFSPEITTWNPMLSKFCTFPKRYRYSHFLETFVAHYEWKAIEAHRENYKRWHDDSERGKPSWVGMLLTQPPITKVIVKGYKPYKEKSCSAGWNIENEKGVMLGDLLDDPSLFNYRKLNARGKFTDLGFCD